MYSSYTEVTTSFMKRGLTRNSVQVAKLTITVQYLQENKKNSTLLKWHGNGGAQKKKLCKKQERK